MEKLAELSWPGAIVLCVLIICGTFLFVWFLREFF
jgi:hypothetical protein